MTITRETATVHVPLSGGREYDIRIGSGLLADAGEQIAAAARGGRAVVVTQPRIAKLWGEPLLASLRSAGFDQVDTLTFPAGERYKTLGTLARLCDGLYNLPVAVDRKTLIIALGGGVVGDVAGFLASVYLRGLDYVQVPTTLLAMVDSSVGGKTGVDFRAGKNLVGTFHQPRAVAIDTDVLGTLPPREFRAGMAEVVKYGFISDPALLPYTEKAGRDTGRSKFGLLTPGEVAHLIRRSCEIKADVVTRDEFETTGLRAVLNYGHTVGHALESATRYRRYKHGEAVGIGMVSAAFIGEVVGATPTDVREAVCRHVRAVGLPCALPGDVSAEDILALIGRDKKAERGRAKFVLARALGDVFLTDDVDEAAVRAGLARQAAAFGDAAREEEAAA